MSNNNPNNQCDCMILNLWSCVNYGAALTCYGVQCLMESLGQNARIINYIPKIKLAYKGSFAEEFAKKYLNLTEPIKNYHDFISLNNECEIFITGSDQVWNPEITRVHSSGVHENIYLLDFVKNKNKKIACAASFGLDDLFNTTLQNRAYSEIFDFYIHQFDAVSVREDDGVKILKNDFNMNSTQILDGAFYIPAKKLEEMTKNYIKRENYIGCFTLPYFQSQKWYGEILDKISKKLDIPVKNYNFNSTKSVEEWLGFIKNADFIVTDSYHAVVFSIIFNVPFIQIANAKTQSRFTSLFRLLNIENNSIQENQTSNFNINAVVRNFDWNNINNIISLEINKAQSWMSNAISKQKEKHDTSLDFINYFISKTLIDRNNLHKKIKYLSNKNKIKRKYYKYKILAAITFGQLKEKYIIKKNHYHGIIRYIRQETKV